MRKILLAAALMALGGMAYGQKAAGSEPFDFLLLDANARAVALGGAYTALASDADALFYNPAGLGDLKSHEATFMHNQFVEGVTQEYAAVGTRQGWGASLNYLNLGKIQRTTLSQPGGTGSSFGASDLAVGVGYGRRVLANLGLGAGVKYIRESLEDVSAGGWAADAGALWDAPVEGLTLGAGVLNVGPDVRFQSSREKLPLQVRGGAAYVFKALGRTTMVLDLTKTRTDKPRVSAGLENVFSEMIAFRVGFNGRAQDAGIGIVGGVGWTWKTLSVDYAFTPLGDLGQAHQVSVNFRFGERAAKP